MKPLTVEEVEGWFPLGIGGFFSRERSSAEMRELLLSLVAVRPAALEEAARLADKLFEDNDGSNATPGSPPFYRGNAASFLARQIRALIQPTPSSVSASNERGAKTQNLQRAQMNIGGGDQGGTARAALHGEQLLNDLLKEELEGVRERLAKAEATIAFRDTERAQLLAERDVAKQLVEEATKGLETAHELNRMRRLARRAVQERDEAQKTALSLQVEKLKAQLTEIRRNGSQLELVAIKMANEDLRQQLLAAQAEALMHAEALSIEVDAHQHTKNEMQRQYERSVRHGTDEESQKWTAIQQRDVALKDLKNLKEALGRLIDAKASAGKS